MIVHLRVSEVALFLAARDQQLELRLALFGQNGTARRQVDQLGASLLAFLAFNGRSRGGGRGLRGRARRGKLLRGLEVDRLALRVRRGLLGRLDLGDRLLHFGMLFDVFGLGGMRNGFRLRGSRLRRLLRQLLRGRCSRTLVLLCHEIPDARAYWGQHRIKGRRCDRSGLRERGRILRKDPPLDKTKMASGSKTSVRLRRSPERKNRAKRVIPEEELAKFRPAPISFAMGRSGCPGSSPCEWRR